MSESWSLPEVELVVADYFAMLWKELAGLPIDKTAHRKALRGAHQLRPALRQRLQAAAELPGAA